MIKIAEMANGIKILTEHIPHVRSVAVGVWVDVGSRDEGDQQAGISHFIEHLMFKGTARRSAKDIAEELDAVGGQLNAFTTKEYTCYYARVLDEHFPLAVDLLSDMLLNSRFDQSDIDRERNVIIEEIKMYEDTPDELVHDILARIIWSEHSLGRPIIGSEQTVGGLSKDTLLAFYKKYYSSRNIVIAVAGNLDQQQVMEGLTAMFGKLSGDKKDGLYTVPKPNHQVVCRTKDTEQVHICLGTPGLPIDHDNIYVFQIVNTILGGGLSSRLFQEIREQRGLVYSVYSYHSSYHDSGLFCVYAGLSKKNVRAALELIVKEIRDIEKNGVTPAELARVKEQLKGNLLLSLENVNSRMSRLGKSQLYLGKVIPPDELVKKVMAVTVEDIKDLTKNIFKPENFCVASIGPWEDENMLLELIAK
ncbi:Predicted Zn-dependent peptidase [Desulfotomaculum arcticum]|uniref:Predicted Zn-dependent peptidase n=1 Tax=Desulfotruncus arcticus DSM 17038 TaxID=1121424 RepID=A0A1I2SBW8_9FIRM|nr:pitrilysin family protein [Desulfotruncus arcticus]SFG49219.1 Predicted Zn-dependent peptidase [Desulfotomaculum arcticum] [Desulfotruncus arcticus DSM 17038]